MPQLQDCTAQTRFICALQREKAQTAAGLITGVRVKIYELWFGLIEKFTSLLK